MLSLSINLKAHILFEFDKVSYDLLNSTEGICFNKDGTFQEYYYIGNAKAMYARKIHDLAFILDKKWYIKENKIHIINSYVLSHYTDTITLNINYDSIYYFNTEKQLYTVLKKSINQNNEFTESSKLSANNFLYELEYVDSNFLDIMKKTINQFDTIIIRNSIGSDKITTDRTKSIFPSDFKIIKYPNIYIHYIEYITEKDNRMFLINNINNFNNKHYVYFSLLKENQFYVRYVQEKVIEEKIYIISFEEQIEFIKAYYIALAITNSENN
jgi:hypothetical protein